MKIKPGGLTGRARLAQGELVRHGESLVGTLAVPGGTTAVPVRPAGAGGEGPPHRDNLSRPVGFAKRLRNPHAAAAQEKLERVSPSLLTALQTPSSISWGWVEVSPPRAHPTASHHLTLLFPAGAGAVGRWVGARELARCVLLTAACGVELHSPPL